MSQLKISVESLFNGKSFLPNQTIEIRDGIIVAIENVTIEDRKNSKSDVLSGSLIPGFIDIQVNGGGGKLFNQSPCLETLKIIASAHQKFGTTGWLPALVTDSFPVMKSAADAVALARQDNCLGVLGIHFEGPYISVAKKGIHSAEFIRKISDEEKKLFSRKDLGQVVVTLAPEVVSPDDIRELVDIGVIVCLGHSNATFEQANEALKAGASGFTHLFNAMSQLTSREPGLVGAALLDESSYAGMILDGQHVHNQSAKLAINTKSNIILVTDAMPLVGSDCNHFDFFGEQINRKGNQLTNQTGQLAGSVLDMNTAVNNAIEWLAIPAEKAVNLATKNPARFLKLDSLYGTLKVGSMANMVLLDDNRQVLSSWIEGNQLY